MYDNTNKNVGGNGTVDTYYPEKKSAEEIANSVHNVQALQSKPIIPTTNNFVQDR